jgi:hypothetical protein
MDEKPGNGMAYLRATRIAAKLQERRWEYDEVYRSKLVDEIEDLGEDFALWLKQNYYRPMKVKAAQHRTMALRYIGAVGEIGAGDLLRSANFDDALIQDIIGLAKGGSQKGEQNFEPDAAYALMGLEIGRRDGELLPTILVVLRSFPYRWLLSNIPKLPYDEETVDVLISILPNDFLYFRREGYKDIVEYSTSYWASRALLEIGDERGIEEMVRSVTQHCSRTMGSNLSLLTENTAFSRYSDFLIEAGTPVVKHLIQALSSEDREVCRLALAGLGGIGDHSAFDAVANFIYSDALGAVFLTANALGELGDPRAIPILLPFLATKIPGAYPAVKGALNKLKRFWQANEFSDVLEHEDEKVVIFAIDALRQIKDRSAIERLSELLESDNRKIKKAAKKALKQLR